MNPSGSHLLLASGSPDVPADRRNLFVVPTPLSSASVADNVVTLPGDFGTAQTHGVVFDRASGRAYVGHTEGISVLDPPYSAIAFTMSLPSDSDTHHVLSYAVELSPDKVTLLATDLATGTLRIFHAPFSAASPHEDLTLPGGQRPDGIAFVPDGSLALVVDADGTAAPAHVFAIAAPYSATSTVEKLVIPQSFNGFEDLAISPDGQYAVLTGNSSYPDPVFVVRAPFTVTDFSIHPVPIADLGFPYGPAGRGAGTVRFWPEPAVLPPQITIDRVSVAEGDSGTTPATLTVALSKASTQSVTVDFATVDGTAHAGTNYQASSGTLTFPPGATQRAISVPVSGNTVSQGGGSDPWFRVVLSNGVHAQVVQPDGYDYETPGRVTIVDDDRPYISTEGPLPDATVGVPYLVGFAVENLPGPLSWSITYGRPPGLLIDDPTGILSGLPTTPTIPGDAESGYFYVNVVGGGFNVSREYHLTVRTDRIFVDGFEQGAVTQVAIVDRSSWSATQDATNVSAVGPRTHW